MKKIKYLAIVLAVSLLLVSLTACGDTSDSPPAAPSVDTSVKDDFKEYTNNTFPRIFEPANTEIVTSYSQAVQTGDGNILAQALSELPAKNKALLDEALAFTPKTTEVQNLHDVFTAAVLIRGEAYAQIYTVLTDLNATEEAIDAAFDLLEDSDATFLDFADEVETMKKDLGFVVN